MPPTLGPVLLDRQPARAAARADRPLAPQPDGHDHSPHRRTPRPAQTPAEAQHPIECGGDSHVALLRRPLNFDSQQPAAEGRRRVAQFVRNPRERLHRHETEAQRALPRKRDPRLTPRWTGEPIYLEYALGLTGGALPLRRGSDRASRTQPDAVKAQVGLLQQDLIVTVVASSNNGGHVAMLASSSQPGNLVGTLSPYMRSTRDRR